MLAKRGIVYQTLVSIAADSSDVPRRYTTDTKVQLDILRGPAQACAAVGLEGEQARAETVSRVAAIDERKRAEALLADENRLLAMIARGGSLSVFLAELCKLVERCVGDSHCSILLVEAASKFRHGAAPSLPASYNEFLDGQPVQSDGGPCAMAASQKTQVIASDLMSDPRWSSSGWRHEALALGLRSCWSTPIFSDDLKVLGVVAIYRREPGAPTPAQQDLVQQFTQIGSIAIERARGEAALKRSEAFLAEAQHLTRTGSFLWRPSSNELTWSKELYRIYEVDESVPPTMEHAIGRLHPDDLETCMEELAKSRRGELVDVDFVVRLQFPDGSIKYLHIVSHRAEDESGNVEYTGAVQDVTEQRRAEEALARLQSELARVAKVSTLGALTASIAHEVNQPLAGILTNASTCLRMLADDPPNLEGALETVRRTIRDSKRAADVIGRLRALFGNKATSAESVDLNEATREVIALSSSEIQRRRVILRTEFDSRLPSITGDRIQLQQVILNLLLNAMEAMNDIADRPRILLIRTEREESDRVRLSVQDSGVGFDRQDPGKLFEAFYTTKDGGMGVGLSVSRSIIERHNGRLWAAPNDGPGATFSFSLPRPVCRPDATPEHVVRNA